MIRGFLLYKEWQIEGIDLEEMVRGIVKQIPEFADKVVYYFNNAIDEPGFEIRGETEEEIRGISMRIMKEVSFPSRLAHSWDFKTRLAPDNIY